MAFWRHQAEGFTLYGHHADLAGLLSYLQDRYETQQLCWKLSGDSARVEISELTDSSLLFSFSVTQRRDITHRYSFSGLV